MKVNCIIIFTAFLFGMNGLHAQSKQGLNLEKAIQLAMQNSGEVKLANAKVQTKKYELQSVKNNTLPEVKAAGQYQRLAKASVNLKSYNSNSDSNNEPAPKVDQLVLGQLNASLPIFSGFKLNKSLKAFNNLYEAENANAMQTKEETAMKVINYCAALYKAQKTVELLKENYKSAEQRVSDFIALEKNEIVAKNDLLKVQLQLAKIQLSLDQAKSELYLANYNLVNFLKMDPGTELEIKESDFEGIIMEKVPGTDATAIESRKDLAALRLGEKASQDNIKIAKSAYYPTLAIVGGYTALDLKNVVTVQNAMNLGLGISYDLSGILKNNAKVNIAKSKAMEMQSAELILTDAIKLQYQRAVEEYNLALKQSAVYTQAVEQAKENYRIIRDKYDNGLEDTNELLEADAEQLESTINKELANANILQKYYQLLAAAGQLDQTFNLSKI